MGSPKTQEVIGEALMVAPWCGIGLQKRIWAAAWNECEAEGSETDITEGPQEFPDAINVMSKNSTFEPATGIF